MRKTKLIIFFLLLQIYCLDNVKAMHEEKENNIILNSIEFYHRSFYANYSGNVRCDTDWIIQNAKTTTNSYTSDTILNSEFITYAKDMLLHNMYIRNELKLDDVNPWRFLFGTEKYPRPIKRTKKFIINIQFVAVLNFVTKKIIVSYPSPYKNEKDNYMIINGVFYKRDFALFTTLYFMMKYGLPLNDKNNCE
jgi:hypothetical protein